MTLKHYTDRTDLFIPIRNGNSNCRLGYGLPIVKYWGGSCVYRGINLIEPYENWLNLSVDHVIPNCTLNKWGEQYMDWIGCIANLVPCCR